MEKRSPVEANILSWLIIIIESLYLWYQFGFWFPFKIIHLTPVISFGGAAIYRVMIILPNISHAILYYISLLWAVVFIICAFGVLKSKNFLRMTVVILSIISILISLSCIFVVWTTMAETRNLGTLVIHFIPICLASVYIYYLTRPKVKEQFK